MNRHLMEAKYEHHMNGTEEQYHLERKLVDCMQVRITLPQQSYYVGLPAFDKVHSL